MDVEVRLTRGSRQSTLRHFRAQVVPPAQKEDLFRRRLELSRTRSLLQGRALQVALDTTPIWGRGAVKDANNLLADGSSQLLRTRAASLKGTAEIAWDAPTAREAFLAEIGVDVDRFVSVHDSEMRHWRESRRLRFDGHKAAVAVDPASRTPRQPQNVRRGAFSL